MHRIVLTAVIGLSLVGLSACKRRGSTVVLTEWAEHPLLLVDGQPFSIRGVTFGVRGSDRKELRAAFEELAAMNVNAIRIWSVDEDTPAILDMAARYNIKVMVGFWLRHGRPNHQSDDRFDWIRDTAGRRAQWNDVLDGVKRLRRHPAVLMWALGNEVILNIGSEEERIAYAKFLGRLVSEVKKLDPGHPVTSAGATWTPWPYWRDYCNQLDFYGVNVYGPVINELDDKREELGVDTPLVFTEFGATAVWDSVPDRNGARLETTDQERYHAVARGWSDWVIPASDHLGGFVFHYEDTSASAGNWWSTRVDGHTRPSYWGIYEAFVGTVPGNRIPTIREFSTRRRDVGADVWIPVDLQIADPEKDPLELEFLAAVAGGDESRKAQPIPHRGGLDVGVEVRTPASLGTWILTVLVKDSHRNMAVAQTSVVLTATGEPVVERPSSQSFPFYVYRNENSPDNHFEPSGEMGDHRGLMGVDFGWRGRQQQGTSIRFDFRPGEGWYGMAWLDPPGDWGDKEGGFDLTGAATLSFLARGGEGDEVVTFGFGLIAEDKKWFDTGRAELKDVRLTRNWRRYSIPLEGRNLSRVKNGFTLSVANRDRGVTFFMDDVKYQ